MIKLLASFLVLMGSTGYGIVLYQEQKERIWHIRYLIQLLSVFLSEIAYRRLSLPDSCRLIADTATEPYKTILTEIYERYENNGRSEFVKCWRFVMSQGMKNTPLSQEERNVLVSLFEEATIYDLDMQKNILESRRTQLEHYLQKRECEISEKKKMYTSLGFMVGLILVLILI